MPSIVCSAGTFGIDAVQITIEVDSSGYGQPWLTMVGLPDLAVREAYARVFAALSNAGFFLVTIRRSLLAHSAAFDDFWYDTGKHFSEVNTRKHFSEVNTRKHFSKVKW
jgi:hypothetical protein